jgi:DNA-directed RNA polymerase specialized sigma24 family protein
VMQIFEQLINDLRTHEVQNFKNWLHTVARNYCFMQLRHQKTTTENIDDEFDMESEPFLHLIENDDLDWEK